VLTLDCPPINLKKEDVMAPTPTARYAATTLVNPGGHHALEVFQTPAEVGAYVEKLITDAGPGLSDLHVTVLLGQGTTVLSELTDQELHELLPPHG
jgi:hypothetical protein